MTLPSRTHIYDHKERWRALERSASGARSSVRAWGRASPRPAAASMLAPRWLTWWIASAGNSTHGSGSCARWSTRSSVWSGPRLCSRGAGRARSWVSARNRRADTPVARRAPSRPGARPPVQRRGTASGRPPAPAAAKPQSRPAGRSPRAKPPARTPPAAASGRGVGRCARAARSDAGEGPGRAARRAGQHLGGGRCGRRDPDQYRGGDDLAAREAGARAPARRGRLRARRDARRRRRDGGGTGDQRHRRGGERHARRRGARRDCHPNTAVVGEPKIRAGRGNLAAAWPRRSGGAGPCAAVTWEHLSATK